MKNVWILAWVLLAGCSGNPSELKLDKVTVIGTVNTGNFGENSYLIEECVRGVPYYLISYRSRFGMAVRYRSDGTIPACLQQAPDNPPEFSLTKLGMLGETKSELQSLCLDNVTYYYADTLYTAGLAPARQPDGRLIQCR